MRTWAEAPESHLTHLSTGVSAILSCALDATHRASCCRSALAEGTPRWSGPSAPSPCLSEWYRHEPSPGWRTCMGGQHRLGRSVYGPYPPVFIVVVAPSPCLSEW